MSDPINGDQSLLAVDRAMMELRRGRAVAIHDPRSAEPPRQLLFAALESASPELIGRLRATSAAGLSLAVTAERARAMGIGAANDLPVLLQLGVDRKASEIARLGRDWQASAWREALGSAVICTETCNRISAAALLLAKRAQLLPAVLIVTPTSPSQSDQALAVSVADIERSEKPTDNDLLRVSAARVPLQDAENSRLVLFRDLRDASEHVAVLIGTPDLARPVPLRMHSSCLTGDLLGSLRCDCGEQLRSAVQLLAAAGGGVLLYLAQEGRGIGLANKLRAYQLQDSGLDTVDADLHLGFTADERGYAVAAAILRDLGISRVQLLTNSPHKIDALQDAGIAVTAVDPLQVTLNRHNARYIRTKRERAGHFGPKAEGRDAMS